MKKLISFVITAVLIIIVLFTLIAPFLNPEMQILGMKPHHIVHKINSAGGIIVFSLLLGISIGINIKVMKSLKKND